ncbi:MAG: hypothetical protein DRH37_00385 [Deltaproteobacteria bacterium]|nr:MAG: hypothetical protein B5M55_05915 [Desulfococcus sp. 4484_242]RLC32504.1 MAG: hypothetical protein DRH37_00385 [Deltaproteobacteria bacterium]
MEKPKVIVHLYSEDTDHGKQAEKTFQDDKYSVSFRIDAGAHMAVSDGVVDIAFLQPSLVDWKWFDIFTKIRKAYPDLPVFLYSAEMGLADGLRSSLEDENTFPSNDISGLKECLDRLVAEKERSKKKVLFVDDDQKILNAYARMLRKTPWEILTASSGEEALEIMDGHQVHLVATDIKMPKMHGIALVSKIREIDENVPIVVCSAYQALKDDANLRLHGVTDFIEKPVDADALIKKLDALLA